MNAFGLNGLAAAACLFALPAVIAAENVWLLFLAVGFYALSVCRGLAKSIEVDLVRNYRTLIAGYELRDAATRMHGALTHLNRSDTLEARQAFETERSRLVVISVAIDVAVITARTYAAHGKSSDGVPENL